MVLEKVLLGITLAAPIGPVSIEIIRRGLTHGFIAAITVCIGATLGDGVFLVSAYLGLSKITSNDLAMGLLGLLGAGLLCRIGYQNLRDSLKDKSINNSANLDKKGFISSVLLGFGLAIINPMSLVFWVGVFAASMATSSDQSFTPNLLILVGVMIWSLTLSTLVSTGKKIINNTFVRVISFLSGALLSGYGVYFGINAINTLQSYYI
jgi:threonine/homoserine/homoserine lactone efflux protein